jgi:hypothetical protein
MANPSGITKFRCGETSLSGKSSTKSSVSLMKALLIGDHPLIAAGDDRGSDNKEVAKYVVHLLVFLIKSRRIQRGKARRVPKIDQVEDSPADWADRPLAHELVGEPGKTQLQSGA